MTRTARASSPQALFKDRSLARNGRDKSIKKNGAGAHGWGSLKDEADLELAAEDDEARDQEEEEAENNQQEGTSVGGEEEADAPRRQRRPSTLGEVKVTVKPANGQAA
ncbi:hypothetical protein FRC20_005036 [Serendipita sp. 405]|nr:hypothetical protein FRC20_005036 [Serendipita sp. 405]